MSTAHPVIAQVCGDASACDEITEVLKKGLGLQVACVAFSEIVAPTGRWIEFPFVRVELVAATQPYKPDSATTFLRTNGYVPINEAPQLQPQ